MTSASKKSDAPDDIDKMLATISTILYKFDLF
jgi:hypothetical protein